MYRIPSEQLVPSTSSFLNFLPLSGYSVAWWGAGYSQGAEQLVPSSRLPDWDVGSPQPDALCESRCISLSPKNGRMNYR